MTFVTCRHEKRLLSEYTTNSTQSHVTGKGRKYTDNFTHANAGFARPEHFKMPLETMTNDELRPAYSRREITRNSLLRNNILYKDLQY